MASSLTAASPSTLSVVKTNGDFALTESSEAVYGVMNGVGLVRSTASAGANTVSLATSSWETGAKISSLEGAFAVAGPIGLLVVGPLAMLTGACWTIPDAKEALDSAERELEQLNKSDSSALMLKEAEHAASVAKLGLYNHGLYFTMGAGQTAAGIVGMMGETAAAKFGYTAVLTGSAATVASTVCSAALGVIYIARGGVVMRRSSKNLAHTHNFYKRLESNKNIDSAIAAIKNEAAERGASSLGRNIDESCLVEEIGQERKIYTADGIKTLSCAEGGRSETSAVYNDEQKQEYLKRVDKGIYAQKLRHRIGMTIGTSMLIGGVLTVILVALSIATGGLAPVAIALASAIFFIVMEFVFLTYDSSWCFEKFRDWTYEESPFLAGALGKSPRNQTLLERVEDYFLTEEPKATPVIEADPEYSFDSLSYANPFDLFLLRG